MTTLSSPKLLHPALEVNNPIPWRWLRRYGDGLIAFTSLMLIVLAIAFAHRLTPHNPTAGMDLRSRFIPPFWMEGGSMDHILGTDNLGRDVLTRTLYGGRFSLRLALIAGTISTIWGMAYGLLSGYMGGWVDRVLMRITDVWVSFPFLVLALALIAAVGSSPLLLIFLLSLAGWVHPARVTRAQTLQLRQLDYVQAAIAIGSSRRHIIRHHILPNVISVNVVMWTFSIGTLVIIEGSLSFLGLGINPPTPSWGNMLSDGRTYLQDAWWMSVFPGLALMLTVLCVNWLGDYLQKLNSYRMLM